MDDHPREQVPIPEYGAPPEQWEPIAGAPKESTPPPMAEFLLARIAEDEAAVTESTRRLAPTGHELLEHFGDYGDDERWMIEISSGRVLAECEAKRRAVEAYVEAWQRDLTGEAALPEGRDWLLGRRWALHEAVQLIALPYADHPDYRKEWRP